MMSKLERLLNPLAVITSVLIVAAALVFQMTLNELPCPLCLLQRLGILAIAFGFMMNIRFGIKPIHYGFSLLAAVFAGAVSLRQILLHIVPGSGHYGSAVLGLHMYTWVFVIVVAFIMGIAVLLMISKHDLEYAKATSRVINLSSLLALISLLGVTFVNAGATLLECGVGVCGADPTVYRLL